MMCSEAFSNIGVALAISIGVIGLFWIILR